MTIGVDTVRNPEIPEDPLKPLNNGEDAKPEMFEPVEEDEKPKADKAEDVSNLSPEEALDKMNELQNKVAEYDKKNAQLDKEIKAKEQVLKAEEAKMKKAADEKEKLEEQMAKEKKQFEAINNAIEKATATFQDDVKVTQQREIFLAMEEYNEEEDGPWDEYIAKRLDGLNFNSAQISVLQSLKGQSTQALNSLGELKLKIADKNAEIKKYSDKINVLKDEIKTTVNFKATIDANIQTTLKTIDDLKFKIVPQAEWDLAKKNNLTLTEKLSDGTPRYVIAQGQKDKKYHIYDMKEQKDKYGNMRKGHALARLYGDKDGTDLVSMGNGFLNNFKRTDNPCDKRVFYLDKCDVMKCFRASYCTSSPLSFDLNNDGVNTSDDIINYDIDGDGKKDRIYDSNDAVLVFDKNGDGISGQDGSECFGDNTDLDGDGLKDGYKNGFEALKALAKKEKLISDNDSKLDENDLAILEDKYGLKIKTNGYYSGAQSLKDVGITEINLAQTDKTTLNKNYDGKNNDLMTQEGATFVHNGETKEYADIWHAKLEQNSSALENSSRYSGLKFDLSDKSIADTNINFKLDNDIEFNGLKSENKELLSKADKLLKKYKH